MTVDRKAWKTVALTIPGSGHADKGTICEFQLPGLRVSFQSLVPARTGRLSSSKYL